MDIDRACAFCRTLPGASEDTKWEDNLVFSVGGKMFAVTSLQPGTTSMAFKVDDERFLEMTDRPGIVPAPYLARARWVLVERLADLPEAEAEALLRRAHALILAKLSKKLQRSILGA